jgi:aspartyl-tRNA(Asn)/glutamyl-tRNA(Gln) amidotransferase subunit A
MHTIQSAANALAAGETSSRALVEACLERIADPAGEGSATFRAVYADSARGMADAMDALRRHGRAPGPYAGIPFSLKDLFDVAGEPTPAGSVVLADAPPAAAHAPLIQRMLAAGLVPLGRTNMTEFAFSGLGINPHHGTPASPWDRGSRRIPGGSSSGAGVSVADAMAPVALGTDTGGSCRIPAAFCGVVGYKPTARRVPLAGVLPLAPSLDSVGPLARSVACCAIVDAILAGLPPAPPAAAEVAGLRLLVPTNYVMEGMDAIVTGTFERTLTRLEAAGAQIRRAAIPELDELPRIQARGGVAATEAYAWHADLLARRGAGYDPQVRLRIEGGAAMTGAEYHRLVAARAAFIGRMAAVTAGWDAVAMPTVPIVAPTIASLDDSVAYGRTNMLVLRNTAIGNFLDRCAISLPCHAPGEAPVGLMLIGETMGDARLFAIAAGVEAALAVGRQSGAPPHGGHSM